MKKLLLAAFLAFAVTPLGAADDDKSLSVTAPASVSVTQGKVKTFKVTIKRTGFTDEVKLTFNLSDLKGVKLVEKDTTIAKDKSFRHLHPGSRLRRRRDGQGRGHRLR